MGQSSNFSRLVATYLKAEADYRGGTDEQMDDAAARLSFAADALALAPPDNLDGIASLTKIVRRIADDEAEDGEWADGRLRRLLSALETAITKIAHPLKAEPVLA